MQYLCRDYRTQVVMQIDCVGDQIRAIKSLPDHPADQSLPWIAPGLFDLQINGAGGVSFNAADLTVEQVGRAIRMIEALGVTGLLPTLVTNELAGLEHALKTLRHSIDEDKSVQRRVPGFHLEGPWISAADGYRGAHPQQYIRMPSWEDFQRLQDTAGGLIKMVTLAPELPGALGFIEQLRVTGVCVSLGHTAADAATIEAAATAGATVSTHVGNGLPEMIHRHLNPLWGHLACRSLTASVIMDGHHIPDELFRTVFAAKGADKLVLISDASSLAGLPPGRYRQWEQDVEMTVDRRLQVVGTPYLAGSASFLFDCVGRTANVLRSENGLANAWDMGSVRPRELLGLPLLTRSANSPDDLVVFESTKDGSIQMLHVLEAHSSVMVDYPQ